MITKGARYVDLSDIWKRLWRSSFATQVLGRKCFQKRREEEETKRKGVRYVDQIAGEKKVTITVPAGVYEFYKDLLAFDGSDRTPEEVFQEDIIALTESTIVELPKAWFSGKRLIEKYGLQEHVNLPSSDS